MSGCVTVLRANKAVEHATYLEQTFKHDHLSSMMRIKDSPFLLLVFFCPMGFSRAWHPAPVELIENLAGTFAKTAVNIYLPPSMHRVGLLPVIRRLRYVLSLPL